MFYHLTPALILWTYLVNWTSSIVGIHLGSLPPSLYNAPDLQVYQYWIREMAASYPDTVSRTHASTGLVLLCIMISSGFSILMGLVVWMHLSRGRS